ncbi:IS3 family transposase [Pseudomonas sp. Z4-7]|uniref:IS3 family transposase n=1 Tax=Pseudomonas sp. Z4-7 TaxID=2817413 RepID=UPI003DA9E648
MGKFSLQFKITAIEAYINGNEGFRKVAHRYLIDYSLLRRWVATYQARGSAGLQSHGHHYSAAFKRSVIQCMQKERLSHREVAARFGLGQSSQVGIWERQYYSGSLPALIVPKRKKAVVMPKKTPVPDHSQPVDDDSKSREQLKAELEYLRMENAYLKKRRGKGSFEEESPREKTISVMALRSRFPLDSLLKLANLARSTFYYQASALQKPDKYASLKTKICDLYDQHEGRFGYRRIALALQKKEPVSEKMIQRLMERMGLKSLVRPKKYRSYRGQVGTVAANLLERNFVAQRPNQKWVTDVTEFKVGSKKLYLSTVMDLYNGEIIAYETAPRPCFALVTGMLEKAFERLQGPAHLLLHSDQGWQYQQPRYQHALKQRGIKQSMSRKGNCLDNAAMESFFGTLKSEFFYLKRFENLEELNVGLDEYISYYNHERIKSKLGGLSPVEYRTQSVGMWQ